MTDTYNAADNSYRCYTEALAFWREKSVRAGQYAPVNDTERQWAKEGPVPNHRLTGGLPAGATL